MNPVSRREVLRSVALPALAQTRPASRPNILWMIAEDFSPDLGCYGNNLVATPRIDALAARGMRFERAFVTGPVCSASRSALATGMYQTSINAHNHRSHRDDGYRLPEGVHVFTHYLREAGYHTSNLRNRHGLQGTGKTDFNFNVDRPFDSDDWSDRRPGQPFYAQINFNETHRAFHSSPQRRIDPAKVTVPPYYPDHPAIRLDWAMYLETTQNLDVKVGRVLDRLEKEGLAEDTIVFFFGDHGRPMPRGKQFLYDEGIRIPLLVHMPERLRSQGYRAASVNSDLVSSIDITATTLALAGVTVPPRMEGRALFGDNVRRREYIIAARDRCDETTDRIRCVRDTRFKYIRNGYPERPYTQQNVYKDLSYPPLRVMRDLKEQGRLTGPAASFMADRRPVEELYDLAADPHEIRNLAGEAAHAARLRTMRATLDGWIRETRDHGETPERDIPATEKLRSEVDGWLTSNGRLSRTPSSLHAEFRGQGPRGISRSIVEPGGELLFEFHARSSQLRPTELTWGTIEVSRSPSQQIKFDLAASGGTYSASAVLPVDGWLSALSIQMEGGDGTIDFDWLRLSRRESGKVVRIREWRFSPGAGAE
jgi:arylsulfatase A-like enzyme